MSVSKYLQVHPDDNVLVALENIDNGEQVSFGVAEFKTLDRIPAKHKFTVQDLPQGAEVIMYGVLVGKTNSALPAGSLLTTANLKHAARDFHTAQRHTDWNKPDVSAWSGAFFEGYHRADGSVGTANYWLVVPMVFCENRNLEIMKEALVSQLGYGQKNKYAAQTALLVKGLKQGSTISIEEATFSENEGPDRVFKNVDGIKFLSHAGGCGGTRDDAQALCALLAGYITHANVAGATVMSLGCQHAQVSMLETEIKKRDPHFSKPFFVLDQQKTGRGDDLLEEAISRTFEGLVVANQIERQPAGLDKLCIGLECGGSDGFSGISANPAIGYTSDLLISLGGTVILSEFPELCGVEQNLSDRCTSHEDAERFSRLMHDYNSRAMAVGSGFDMNPSPGNIRDGLITDAIKSAGAAKKGGNSPVTAVLDYPEKVTRPGLNLLCTPGNDVESTTAEVASGANIVLFTTGLGTPTGNPIVPVIKISSNSSIYQRMSDIIDIDAGGIIRAEESIEQAGSRILDYVIAVASGKTTVAAVRNGQDDFIPWKRGVSL